MKKIILISMALTLVAAIFAEIIPIGTGTAYASEPIGAYYGYHRSASIYTQAELGGIGKINSISFQAQNTNAAVIPIKVYMMMTRRDSFVSDTDTWPSLIQYLSPVYQGNISGFTAGEWKSITLSTPFNYNSSGYNLRIMIESNYGGAGEGYGGPRWFYSNAPSQHLYMRSYTNPPTPTTTGSLNSNRPNIRLNMSNFVWFSPPVLGLFPNLTSWDFGETHINIAKTKQFTIYNSGAGNLHLNSITTSSNYYSIIESPADIDLSNGESASFTVQYLPTAVGTQQNAIVTINNNMAARTINFSASCYYPGEPILNLPFFEGFETGNADNSSGINGWSQIKNATQFYYWLRNSESSSGIKPRTGQWNATLSASSECSLYRPIQLIAGNNYYIKLYARPENTSSQSTIKVSYGDYYSLNGMNRIIINTTVLSSLAYQTLYGVFSPPATGLYYLGIYGSSASSNQYIALDDITIDQLPTSPILFHDPTTINFGNKWQNQEQGPRNITITNEGGSILNLSANELSIIGANAAQFRIGTTNLPAALNPGHSIVIPVYGTANIEGSLSATLRISHNQTGRNYDIPLSITGLREGSINIGTGNNLGYLPILTSANYSYSQSIFLQSEINVPGKCVDKLYYYWNGYDEAINSNDWTIYMGHTSLTAFANNSSWIPLGQLSQVFQGEVLLPAEAGWVEIPLAAPFLYSNQSNLVIAVLESRSGKDQYDAFFFCTVTSTARSLYIADATNPPNPASPLSGSTSTRHPNILLSMATPVNKEVTIGVGTGNTYEPIASYWGYHRSAAIYLPGELGGSGTIYTIAYKAATTTTTVIPIKIYMKMTTASSLAPAAPWATLIAGLSPLYEGTISVTSVGGWKTITLTTPFIYTGNNLEILIESNYGGTGTSGPKWYYSPATNRNQFIRKDSSAPTTEVGTVDSNRPDIQLDIRGFHDFPPSLAASPASINFSSVVQSVQTGPQNVTISNNGGSTLNITASDLSLSGINANQFSLVTTNLPAALSAGQSVEIPVYVTANTVGTISANLRIVSSQTNTVLDIALSAEGLPAGIVVIGNGTVNLGLPVDPYYGYTYSQSIYLQSEINTAGKRIEKLYYYWNGVSAATKSNDWTIYMGHTALTSFETNTSWVPFASLSQVFQGEVALPASAGWIEIPLSTAFDYNNMDNLVIAIDENEANHDTNSHYFLCTGTATKRSIRNRSDSINPNPSTPPSILPTSGYPNVMLFLVGDIAEAPELGISSTGTLNWTPVSGAALYQIYKASDPNIPFEPYATTTGTSWTDPLFPQGKAFYQVKAVDSAGK
ncbi:MAG: choice-of-anchor D domain-containing protein [Candidatus Cloacimonetes bacterium]|nr:choice-of-anchor D domain-containing protein [Candidatus Cloacimonadota bacterium]